MDITMSQRDDCAELGQEEGAEHRKVEKEEKKSSDIRKSLSKTEREEKARMATEVGLKKIFRFVGFKFTVKKEQSEKAEPVKEEQLESNRSKVPAEDANTEEVTNVKNQKELEESGMEVEPMADLPLVKVSGEVPDIPGAIETTPTDEGFLKTDVGTESPTKCPEEVQFPLKIFTQEIFSDFGMKVISTQPIKEKSLVAVKDELKESEENAELSEDSEKSVEAAREIQKEECTISEVMPQTAESPKEKLYEDEIEGEIATEAYGPKNILEQREDTLEAETSSTECVDDDDDDGDDDDEPSSEEESPVMSFEAELLSSLEKKLHYLFIGSCRKRFPTKQQASKEVQLAGDGDSVSEELQSPEESTDGSAEQCVQMEDAVEIFEDTNVLANEERKNNGKLPWTSLRKLITPSKRVIRSSEIDDEEANLMFAEEEEEQKPSEENQEIELDKKKPKKKIHSSVSWETLLCLRSAKKRAKKGAQDLASEHEIEGSFKVDSDAPPDEQKEINEKILSEEPPENDGTSGNSKVVPVGCKITGTETVLQEDVENVGLMLDALLVKIADEQQEVTTLPVIPQIMDEGTKDDKTVLLADKKTDAIAIYRDIESKDFELVDEALKTADSAVTKTNKEKSELSQIVGGVPEIEIKGLHDIAPALEHLKEDEMARHFETPDTEDIPKPEAIEELVFGQSTQITEVSIILKEKCNEHEDIEESTNLDASIIDIKSDLQVSLTNVGCTVTHIVEQEGDMGTFEAKATPAEIQSTIIAPEKIQDVIDKGSETAKESESPEKDTDMVIPGDLLTTRNKTVNKISKELEACETKSAETGTGVPFEAVPVREFSIQTESVEISTSETEIKEENSCQGNIIGPKDGELAAVTETVDNGELQIPPK